MSRKLDVESSRLTDAFNMLSRACESVELPLLSFGLTNMDNYFKERFQDKEREGRFKECCFDYMRMKMRYQKLTGKEWSE